MFSFLSFGRWKISDFVCHAVMSCSRSYHDVLYHGIGFSGGQGEGNGLMSFLFRFWLETGISFARSRMDIMMGIGKFRNHISGLG